MTTSLSTEATNQITNGRIDMYAACKMYDANDTYLCDGKKI